ncbi:peptidoglycan DD-metalloendopeptidase family protein [Streptomyces sp900116325]|uniref:peptidoglycan DD-metalloendopeptidase family protein n=1 Tax=Streptomyces sp. 900116325 TaxID=3154295 RepID=UPI003332BF1E
MANVGYATLQIIPSVRGIGDELRRQLVGPAEDAGEQAGESAGGGFGDTFKGALAAIGVAEIASRLGGQFSDAFGQALEQQHVTKVLKAQLGSTGADAARQGEAVGVLFTKGITENFEQGAEAVREIVRGGLVPPGATLKQLELIGTRMTDVATTFGTDMNFQGQAVAAMLKNKLAPDAEAALDIIAAGFQKLGPNAEDLLETFQEYSVQLRKLGLDAQTSLGLFQQGLQGGARDTDIIADAFKEFSIRAIDMSTTSVDAYKLLGLNAEKMSLQISRGGSGAASGLQLVLDKLRAIKDPVKQNAAAVGLFGTQAEDLGAALFKLDPSTAAAAFGSVDGAARKLGETLRSGPSHEIKVFTRTIKQGLVDFIGGQVIPVVMAWAAVFTTVLMPPITTVGGVLGATLVPAVVAVGSAFAAGVRWLRDYGAWLLPVGVAVAGLTITMNASAIAIGAVTAVFSVYRGVLLAAAAVTRGYAVVQGLLNAVMSANPVGLVITGIAALVTLIVVAYNESETFRNIVQAAWSGIKVGWDAVWTAALKPGLEALMTALRAVGSAAVWLWQNVLSPVFSFIATAGKVLVARLLTVVLTPIVIGFQVLASQAQLMWTGAIKPVFDWIGGAAKWLWANGLKPLIDNTIAHFKLVGSAAVWLWTGAIKPVFEWIVGKAIWLWANGIKPQFGLFVAGLKSIGSAATWLWNSGIKPAFDGIASLGRWLWNNSLKPQFELIKKGIGLVGSAFGLAKDAIGAAWNQVSGIAKKPVNFIIEWVYTKGIKATWDKVASFVGLGKLPAAPKLLAAGGTVGDGWGPAAPMKVNRPTAIVGEGNPRHPEFVIPTDPKYRGRALSLWEAAGTQLMAKGGIIGDGVDWLTDKAKKVGGAVMSGVDFLADPGKMWEKATAFIRDRVAQIGSSGWAQALARFPGKMIGGLKDKIVNAAKSVFSGGGGGGGSWARPVSAAIGTRYGVKGGMWSSGYHTGTDFPAATGTAVRSVAGGIVQKVSGSGPYGNHITINHGGLSSLYAHLSQVGVTAGQRVLAGMRIGAVGSTGNSTGPHLHLEARRGGRTINPEPLMGYSNGGSLKAGQWGVTGEDGPELVRFGAPATVFPHEESLRITQAASSPITGPSATTGGGQLPREITLTGPLYLEGGQLLGMVRGVVREEQSELVMQATAGRRS